MDVYIFKLKFKGAVHFGDTGIDLENVQESVSSDTFFSALINVVNIYYGFAEAGRLIDRFLNSPPFIITSLFIYHKEFYFLPKPMDDLFLPEEIKRIKGKELKNLKWLDRENFLKFKQQNSLTVKDIDEMIQGQSAYKSAYRKEIRPRVVLDRGNQQSSIYHCGYIHFSHDAGLYGLVAFKEKDFIEKFKNILYFLGQTGIGGERTYGCGMFESSVEPADSIFLKILKEEFPNYTLLSLYHPSNDEWNNLTKSLVSYDIIRKKGWITSGRNALPLKRKSVGFITEGSVLKTTVTGSLVDVTPDDLPAEVLSHRVYRYGYSFTSPLKEVQQ